MALLQIPQLIYTDIFSLDMFDVTEQFEGVDFTGKTLMMQIRMVSGGDVLVEFTESDGTLTKTETNHSLNYWDVRFYQKGYKMNLPERTYNLSVIMYTNDVDIEDVQTIAYGTMSTLNPIAKCH